MSIPKRAVGSLAFLCLTLTTSFAATELLYVQEGANILTYSVNNCPASAGNGEGVLSLR